MKMLLGLMFLLSASVSHARDEAESVFELIAQEGRDYVKADKSGFEAAEREVDFLSVSESLARNELTLTRKNGARFSFPLLRVEERESFEQFEQLSAPDQEKFLKARRTALDLFANVLNSIQGSSGIGYLLPKKKKKFRVLYDQPERKGIFRFLQRKKKDFSVQDSLFQSTKKEDAEKAAHSVMSESLEAFDRYLWARSRLIARVNEVSFFGAVAVPAFVSVGRGFGVGLTVGLNVGLNLSERAALVEVFADPEVLKSGVVVMTGVTVKFGLQLAYTGKDKMRIRNGEAFYPPGAPAFTYDLDDMAGVGLNFGLLTAPAPPPLDNGFTYRTKDKRLPVVRLMFSPLYRGFVRPYTGLKVPALVQQKFSNFRQMVNVLIERRKKQGAQNVCRAFF